MPDKYTKGTVMTDPVAEARVKVRLAQEALAAAEAEKKAAQREAWRLARHEEEKRRAAFRAKLEEEEGMVGHAKADLLWDKAWEQGHASGLESVRNAYLDLIDLVR